MISEPLNHPALVYESYNTILLSWQEGGFRFFEPLGNDGSSILILDTYYFAYLLCFVFSALFARHATKTGRIGLKPHQTFDAFLFTGLGIMLGAKIAYVLFYNLEFYLQNPSQILFNWSGMASHGAILGGASGLILYALKQKVNVWKLLDHGAFCASFVPIFIRAANFLNAELFGRSAPDWLPWKMRFPMRGPTGEVLFINSENHVYQLKQFNELGEPIPNFFVEQAKNLPNRTFESFQSIQAALPQQVFKIRMNSEAGEWGQFARLITDPSHPSQFYQAIVSGVFLFSLMIYFYRKNLKPGYLFCLFISLYGLSRFLMEFFRQPDPQRSEGIFQWISMGQILSFTMIGVGFFLFTQIKKQSLTSS